MIFCILKCLGVEQEQEVPRQGLKPLRPSQDCQWVQLTPEKFHSSPWENAVKWAQSLLPAECQDFLNTRGRDALEVISSADKETEIEILHLVASKWSADKEKTKNPT